MNEADLLWHCTRMHAWISVRTCEASQDRAQRAANAERGSERRLAAFTELQYCPGCPGAEELTTEAGEKPRPIHELVLVHLPREPKSKRPGFRSRIVQKQREGNQVSDVKNLDALTEYQRVIVETRHSQDPPMPWGDVGKRLGKKASNVSVHYTKARSRLGLSIDALARLVNNLLTAEKRAVSQPAPPASAAQKVVPPLADADLVRRLELKRLELVNELDRARDQKYKAEGEMSMLEEQIRSFELVQSFIVPGGIE